MVYAVAEPRGGASTGRPAPPYGEGAWGAVRSVYRALRRRMAERIDRTLGVRTAFLEPHGAARGEDDPAIAARPCGWLTLWRAFHWLDLAPRDVVIDFGSGPGRAVLVAASFKVARVIGVERDPVLHEQARRNLQTSRLRRATPAVELICSDVLDYRMPNDVSVVFFYNPFRGPVFHHVATEILRSVDAWPRRLRVVYVNPQEHEHLIATGRFRLIATLLDKLRPGRDWARMVAVYVYEVVPDPASAGAVPSGAPLRSPPNSAS